MNRDTGESVIAVVVTYNRINLLLECLRGLLTQSRALGRIIVIDNASSDGTFETLRSCGYTSHALIEYVRLEENSGGAGGFCEGVRRAFEAGCDWIWLMDDDAEPGPEALERMSAAFADNEVVGVANWAVSPDGTPQYQHRGWFKLCGVSRHVVRPISDVEHDIDIQMASFVGLAVRCSAVEKIGYPRREFFLHADDVEYCLRLASIGRVRLVRDSVIVHKEEQSAALVAKSVGGVRKGRVPLEKLWLRYYGPRNVMWLRRRSCGAVIAALSALNWLARAAIGIILYDDHKLLRLCFYIRALCDGWNGVFDNDKPRLLLKSSKRP